MKDMAKFKKWKEQKELKDKNNHGKSVNDLGQCYFVNRLKTKAEEQGNAAKNLRDVANKIFTEGSLSSAATWQNGNHLQRLPASRRLFNSTKWIFYN